MKTKIYGASDDLIEIEGAIDDEIGAYDLKKPKKIEASDGTNATIFYNGEWKIAVQFAGDKYLKLIESVGDDEEHADIDAKGCSSYSDVLIFDEGIEWIKIGNKRYG